VELEGALLEERKFYSTKGGHFQKHHANLFLHEEEWALKKKFHLMLYAQ
jgi:hypothetical protein